MVEVVVVVVVEGVVVALVVVVVIVGTVAAAGGTAGSLVGVCVLLLEGAKAGGLSPLVSLGITEGVSYW